jgi:ER membrane protein complex subunit 1, C-terminal
LDCPALSTCADHSNHLRCLRFLSPLPYSPFPRSTLGMAHKNILIGFSGGQLFSIDHRMIHPRRPMGTPTNSEKEEGLSQYNPFIPIIPQHAVTQDARVAGEALHVVTAPGTVYRVCQYKALYPNFAPLLSFPNLCGFSHFSHLAFLSMLSISLFLSLSSSLSASREHLPGAGVRGVGRVLLKGQSLPGVRCPCIGLQPPSTHPPLSTLSFRSFSVKKNTCS